MGSVDAIMMPTQQGHLDEMTRSRVDAGAIAVLVGAVNFSVSQHPFSRTYSLAITTLGLVQHLLQRRALREEVQSRRYGPRDPYDTERGFRHIEYLLTRPSERLFKGWFR